MKLEEPRRKITIEDVFRHTAGFSDITLIGNPGNPVAKAYFDAGLNITSVKPLKDQMNILAKMPLLYHPGEQWVYSVAHEVQVYLVEYFSGMPFDEFVSQILPDLSA
jgi:CubicO group peptidase (beta-lactamase class C family)